jgi:RNA polymerase sigma factor (sigma-70 family)
MTATPTMTELLTKEQEYAMIREVQEDTRKAQYSMDRLVRHNMGLVHKQVQRFPLRNSVVTYDDLFQQGVLGFMHAVRKFDLDMGLRLSTYAYRWIAAYLQRYWQNNGRTVRVPAHLSDSFFAHKREVNELTVALGRTPSADELPEHVAKVAQHFAPIASLNQSVGDGNEELCNLQAADDDSGMVMEVESYLEQLKGDISSRDYQILVMRFGLDGCGEHSLSEIASTHSVSRARIHQILSQSLHTLKGYTM